MPKDINDLTVQEKRGLEPLIRRRYDNLISQLRDTEKHDITDLVSRIAKKFKMNAALAKIREHTAAIEKIKNAIEELGFQMSGYNDITGLKQGWDRDTGSYSVDYKKPAGKMYYNLTKARPDIMAVEKQRDKAITDLWLITTKDGARKIVDTEINVPKLEMK